MDNSGKVTANGAGSASITVTTGDGGKTAKCSVKVTEPVTAVAIQGTPKVNQTLTANVTPSTATVTYEWQEASSDGGPYSAIDGATSKTYQLQEAQNGKYVKVKVVGTSNYTGEATSTSVNVTGAES